jgi:serine/threonine protein kinase/Rieske Fe-S protein
MQAVSVDQLVGKTLGDYHVERLLGRGKLSAVYLAQQHSQNRTVMITTFTILESLSIPARERFTARFSQVGSALVKLNHPHILPIYDCGVQFGSPYLVTSFVKGGSLAQVLKQQQRFTPEQASDMLKQIAAGLDYAHSQGIVHGILNPANILVSNEQVLQVTGFGLKQMLQMQGIEESYHPQAHLFSIAGTFLGSPEYIAPECVLGAPVDARADVYALGIMLFELLSGSPPFTGTEPLEIATKRLQQPVPSLHESCPDLPAAFDLILYQALEREPEKRYKYTGEMARAFGRVLKVLEGAARDSAALNKQTTMHSQITLPPTVNWFDEEIVPTRKWQLKPPVVTGHIAAVQGYPQEPAASLSAPANGTNDWQSRPQVVTDHAQAVRPVTAPERPSPADSQNLAAAASDPFAWWSATSARTTGQVPGTFARNATKRPTGFNANTRRKASIKGRRQVVVGLLAGTGVVGILGIGGISFAHFIESMKQAQPGNTQSALTTTSPAQGATPAATHGTQQTPTASKTPKAQPSPTKATQPTPQPTPRPTRPPQPTPTAPPSHTGTVIGYTSQPTNSGKNFTNPADGNGSILVHLPNGNFVACERQCTHAGVNVNYDPGSNQLVCPAHGAVFDPANGFNLVQGPGNGPLPGVSIRVNADGTITTG